MGSEVGLSTPLLIEKDQANAVTTRHNRLEWTVEIAFQPRLRSDPAAPLPPPTRVTTVPQPSTHKLHAVLIAALGSRDKKGKGKAVEPTQDEWARVEKAWIESLRPQQGTQPATTEAGADAAADPPAAEAPSETLAADSIPTAPPATEPEQSPFELLLAFFSRSQHAPPPPEPSDDDSDDEDESDSESAASSESSDASEPDLEADLAELRAAQLQASASAQSQTTPKPPTVVLPTARRLYRIPVDSTTTLQDALSGSSILETPLFELWPRETLAAQVSRGKIEVLVKPTAEQAAESRRVAEEARFAARGRGRGRGGMSSGFSGRGRGGGEGRGGYTGGYRARGGAGGGGGRGRGGRSDYRSTRDGAAADGDGSERQQDSGWGKRGPAQDGPAVGDPAEKRPRV